MHIVLTIATNKTGEAANSAEINVSRHLSWCSLITQSKSFFFFHRHSGFLKYSVYALKKITIQKRVITLNSGVTQFLSSVQYWVGVGFIDIWILYVEFIWNIPCGPKPSYQTILISILISK